jgi:hypothetical protein
MSPFLCRALLVEATYHPHHPECHATSSPIFPRPALVASSKSTSTSSTPPPNSRGHLAASTHASKCLQHAGGGGVITQPVAGSVVAAVDDPGGIIFLVVKDPPNRQSISRSDTVISDPRSSSSQRSARPSRLRTMASVNAAHMQFHESRCTSYDLSSTSRDPVAEGELCERTKYTSRPVCWCDRRTQHLFTRLRSRISNARSSSLGNRKCNVNRRDLACVIVSMGRDERGLLLAFGCVHVSCLMRGPAPGAGSGAWAGSRVESWFMIDVRSSDGLGNEAVTSSEAIDVNWRCWFIRARGMTADGGWCGDASLLTLSPHISSTKKQPPTIRKAERLHPTMAFLQTSIYAFSSPALTLSCL